MDNLKKTLSSSATLDIVKIFGLIHFILTGFALLGLDDTDNHFNGCETFVYSNLIFMATLIWILNSKTSLDATEAALLVDASIIVFDILGLIPMFQSVVSDDSFGSKMPSTSPSPSPFSTLTAKKVFLIINLIVRPLSVFFLYQEYEHRKGPTTKMGQQKSTRDIEQQQCES